MILSFYVIFFIKKTGFVIIINFFLSVYSSLMTQTMSFVDLFWIEIFLKNYFVCIWFLKIFLFYIN
jgi:hypothetical protein